MKQVEYCQSIYTFTSHIIRYIKKGKMPVHSQWEKMLLYQIWENTGTSSITKMLEHRKLHNASKHGIIGSSHTVESWFFTNGRILVLHTWYKDVSSHMVTLSHMVECWFLIHGRILVLHTR